MRLKNRFDNADKMRVWLDNNFCCLCGSNQGCSVHHIYGTVSSSLFNSSMLCHDCHKHADTLNSGGVGGIDFRRRLLKIAFKMVSNSDYKTGEKDSVFLEYIKEDVAYLLKEKSKE